ncbi:MAG: helix-turn-helix transcriptional regulator [Lachnospiraceae bacterium]|nr:helix-turn-helix transcriptional regulator [Lachnospiraceae bacterium]MBR1849170.1 helix-turn-helix transcriptional regulator [Lachnospiraceae bacterium]
MERVNQRTNHILGFNIKRLRVENNLRNIDVITQLQLHGVSVSSSTYAKVESGANNPSVDMLIALTHIFKCDFNAFFKS